MSDELIDAGLEKKIGDALVDDSVLVPVDYRAAHSKCLLFKDIKIIDIVISFICEGPCCEIILNKSFMMLLKQDHKLL